MEIERKEKRKGEGGWRNQIESEWRM